MIIISGGPGRVAAALTLARARHRALLLSDGRGRNGPAGVIHGLAGRDRTPPAEFRRLAREQPANYPA